MPHKNELSATWIVRVGYYTIQFHEYRTRIVLPKRLLSYIQDMAQFLRIFIPLLVLLALASCAKIEEEPVHLKSPVERPQMLFLDTTFLDFYDGKLLSWRLKTAWLERWGGAGKVFARPVLVDIFDSTGTKAAFLRSDSGELDSRMSYVRAYGHVYALTPKGASVRADSLIWNKRDNKVHTASVVRVVSENGDVLQGRGFLSDAKLENWQILSEVTGIFQDAAARMKDEDSVGRQEHLPADTSKKVQTPKPLSPPRPNQPPSPRK